MKIMLTSNYFPEHPGGIESVAAQLASGYRSQGHEVRWAAADVRECRHPRLPGDRALLAWNVTERRLGFPYPLVSPLDLLRLLDDVRWADVLHLNDCLYALNLACFQHARTVGRPVLVTQHVPHVPYTNPLLRATQRSAYSLLGHPLLESAQQVVFVSDAVAKAYDRLHFERLPIVIENAIDTALFSPADSVQRSALRRGLGITDDATVLLFVGRFVAKKGLPRLRQLARAMPDVQLLLVGRAGDVDPVRWREPNVRVLPSRPQAALRDLYVAADLLVLPSEGEGFPVSVQEAMACGTPAIVSESTAASLPDLDQLLFVAGPDLATSVGAALGEARLRRAAVAEMARQRWTPARMIARYEEALRDISTRPGVTPR